MSEKVGIDFSFQHDPKQPGPPPPISDRSSSLQLSGNAIHGLCMILYRPICDWSCSPLLIIPPHESRAVVHHDIMNGCSSASLGAIRFAGSRWRHLSNRSMKLVNCLSSSSFIFNWTELGGSSLDRRSRVALLMTRVLSVS